MLRLTILGLFAAWAPSLAMGADPKGLDDARRLLQTGKYQEAREAYDELAKAPGGAEGSARVKIALGQAECLSATGEADQAIELLKPLTDEPKPSADVLARVADLHLGRGRWTEADASARKALAVEPDHLAARWVVARLQEARGEIKPAVDTCEWFIAHYNKNKARLDGNAGALLLIGQASERYARAKARGEELSQSLNDVISELYEGALKADPRCWQAPLLEGRLFLLGYNEAAAMKELNKALTMNPHAPELLVTLGQADLQSYKLSAGRKRVEAALAVNPRYAPAHVLLADLNITDERFLDALAAAREAVAEDPKSEEALARLAATYRLLVDPVGASAVEAVVMAINPKPAAFFTALGDRLADRRKYHSAERAFLRAMAADPDAGSARIGLGMLYMQIGREAEARDLFTAAFAADPFNVRANNMMEVLKHLTAFSPVSSAHYNVVADPKDAMLARYMSKYLESIHNDLTTRFGFSPPGPTQIEIMDTHRWFSARTTGLSFIPTVGACTGKVVALATPRGMPKPFNWARVMAHEVTHVITLQQTDFNIPHWYTEALAVESENAPRPQPWNKLLQERVPARKLLNLDTINLGFIRPKEPDERQLAYCQAQLYARYMLKRFGPTAQIKMLDAYRRGMTTDKAIVECFGVDKADFEAQYLAYLDEVVKSIRTRVKETKATPETFSELQRKVKASPDDADLNARMAYEFFALRDTKEARPFADKALKLKPHHPLASWVKARLLESIGDSDAALELLKPALDPDKPDERVLDKLAELEMLAGNRDEAERLYELGRKDDPFNSKWIAGLARVHLRKKDETKFLADLTMLAENDADDLLIRQNLAERHLKAGQADKAEKWAMECLFIQVMDPANHALLADTLLAQKKYDPAIEEYQTAIELKAKKPNDLKVRIARARLGLDKKDEARVILDAVLKADPEHPDALALKEEMDKAK